jgi:2-phosphosulfolactate phosphatase
LKVDVALTNSFDNNDLKVEVKGSVVAVIDVIRATSSIAALFGSGVNKVTVASTLEKAFEFKKEDPEKLLCGEAGGHPPEGFDHGNSPLDFSRLDLYGKQAILKTTNGTASFLRARESPAVYSLAALNFRVTLEKVLEEAKKLNKDILFICSGELEKIAYDDAYIAGLAIRDIMKTSGNFEFSDSAKLVLSAVLGDTDLKSALEKSTSAISLRGVGLGDDISFCARLNEYNLVIKAIIEGDIPQLQLD